MRVSQHSITDWMFLSFVKCGLHDHFTLIGLQHMLTSIPTEVGFTVAEIRWLEECSQETDADREGLWVAYKPAYELTTERGLLAGNWPDKAWAEHISKLHERPEDCSGNVRWGARYCGYGCPIIEGEYRSWKALCMLFVISGSRYLKQHVRTSLICGSASFTRR